MATYSVSRDASCYYANSKSASETDVPIKHTPVDRSPLGGLGSAPIYPFIGISDLRKHVHSQTLALQKGRTNQQYLAFRGVTEDSLAKIDCKRASIGKHMRMTHYVDTGDLIIKLMPSAEHEAAHIELAFKFRVRFLTMGLPDDCLYGQGATRFLGQSNGQRSSIEGDSAFKPSDARPNKHDWPTIVFESGLSETLNGLRHDADWWLSHSGGDVKIVIIISVKPAEKRLHIEKWSNVTPLTTRPATRAHPIIPVPTMQNKIDVVGVPTQPPSYAVTGAPLLLEFDKILLRAPAPPEGDIIFTAGELSQWAASFWRCLK